MAEQTLAQRIAAQVAGGSSSTVQVTSSNTASLKVSAKSGDMTRV